MEVTLGLIILLRLRKIYEENCQDFGKENLDGGWWGQVVGWFACGFWALDIPFVIILFEIVKAELS